MERYSHAHKSSEGIQQGLFLAMRHVIPGETCAILMKIRLKNEDTKLIIILNLLPCLFSAFVVVLSLLAPYLEYQRMAISEGLYAILRLFCHQIPTRSFWIVGSNLGVCARCFGLYISFLSTWLLLVVRFKRHFLWKWGIVLIIPILLDGITQNLGLRMSTNYLRFSTGILGGAGVAILFFPVYSLTVQFSIRIVKAWYCWLKRIIGTFFSELRNPRPTKGNLSKRKSC